MTYNDASRDDYRRVTPRTKITPHFEGAEIAGLGLSEALDDRLRSPPRD